MTPPVKDDADEKTVEVSLDVLSRMANDLGYSSPDALKRELLAREPSPQSSRPAGTEAATRGSGLTTFAALLDRGALGLEEALRIMVDVLRDLSFAHKRSAVKKNQVVSFQAITPQRIVLRPDGVACLLPPPATRKARPTRSEARGYMAPEMLLGDEVVDHRSEIFSIGVLLWELVSGERLFPQQNAAGLLAALVSCHERRPRLSPSRRWAEPVVDVALRALALDPKQRWQSAGQMASALLRACDNHLAQRGSLQSLLRGLELPAQSVGTVRPAIPPLRPPRLPPNPPPQLPSSAAPEAPPSLRQPLKTENERETLRDAADSEPPTTVWHVDQLQQEIQRAPLLPVVPEVDVPVTLSRPATRTAPPRRHRRLRVVGVLLLLSAMGFGAWQFADEIRAQVIHYIGLVAP